EPSARTLAATRYFRSLDYSSAHLLAPPSRRSKILLEKREHLLPAVNRRLRAIGYTGIVEEAVPCARVHVKLVILPILLQLLLPHTVPRRTLEPLPTYPHGYRGQIGSRCSDLSLGNRRGRTSA